MRRAVAPTRNGRIGVIGTQAPTPSHAHPDALAPPRDTPITPAA